MKKSLLVTVVLITVTLIFAGCIGDKFTDADLNVGEIVVSSSSIVDGKLLTITAANREPNNPLGENQSPELSWEAVEGANYYAVILFDETANWLHFFKTDITSTQISQGEYTDDNVYIGPYPPKSGGTHTYRVEVFAIKDQPNDTIGKLNAKNSYSGIVNHLNQVGNNSDNILARGYVQSTYTNGDNTVVDAK